MGQRERQTDHARDWGSGPARARCDGVWHAPRVEGGKDHRGWYSPPARPVPMRADEAERLFVRWVASGRDSREFEREHPEAARARDTGAARDRAKANARANARDWRNR